MNLIEHVNLAAVVDLHLGFVCRKLNKPIKNREYAKHSVFEKLALKLAQYTSSNDRGRFLFEYLLVFHEEILTRPIGEIAEIIEDVNYIKKKFKLNFHKKRSGKKPGVVYTKLYNDIVECFDYNNYVSNEYPYKILEKLDVTTCPYCNRQFVNTYLSEDGKTRATLDHFYSKSEYPYLAISFYNLIPSCYSCNSSIKGIMPFSFANNIHPYQSSFEKIVGFTIGYKKRRGAEKYIAEFYANPSTMRIMFKPLVSKRINDYKKAANNIKTFCLVPLYNLHKDYVIELLQKEVVYRKSGYAKILARKYAKIFSDENDVLKLILGNYVSPDDFCKRPFSRLVRDISSELGLLDRVNKGYRII